MINTMRNIVVEIIMMWVASNPIGNKLGLVLVCDKLALVPVGGKLAQVMIS